MTSLAVTTSAQAVTWEADFGKLTAREGCAGYGIMGNNQLNSGMGCFEQYGDVIRVWSRNYTDGSPRAYWANELKDSNGVWKLYREGVCYGDYARNSWVSCNKDFYENTTSPNALGGKGSRIKLTFSDAAGETRTATILNDM
ncbi:hypothetical protein ACWCXE_21670 [Streptomyces sp. NPDC001780]